MDNLIIRECAYKDLDKVISLQEQWEIEDITYLWIVSLDFIKNMNIKHGVFKCIGKLSFCRDDY